ncbi:MAG: 4-alpha-glucanotransferase, partial [Elusimicrobia bacterium]|nr:4-alpha-glucanotransferase [Elusimicrobiota bacterium]
FKYLQWIVHKQWQKAKESAQINGIKLFGDLPFMVNQESADVWSRQIEFDLTREIGAPPDAFSKTGQKWGLPAPDWAEMEKNNFEWWSMRIKKAACFYDIFRIDHMVGFFRTWIIPNDPRLAPDFDIKTAEYQKVRGKKFLQTAVSASPALPVAEDLGVIPPYVRETLRELNVPGYKVLRWEKESGEYIDTEKYLPVSLATTSTHDNEPLAQWWKIISAGEKRLFWKMISGRQETPPPFSKARSRIIKKLLESSSCLAVLPIQDIFGLKDRINIPNTVGSHNWSYRFAAPVENFLTKHAETIENFRKTVEEAGRG